MTYYPDLSPCTYFPGGGEHVLAVGWLGPSDFAKGDVEAEFIDRLCELLEFPWGPVACCGWHNCGFCESTGPLTYRHKSKNLGLGISNLFVPTQTKLYVAPSLILHYISKHNYQPPECFVEAVRSCPPQGSPQYMEMIWNLVSEDFGIPPQIRRDHDAHR